MFLPISVFTLNMCLAILQLLLVGALASILAIYSRFCGEYANSVRWAYHGGYKDMVTSLYKSCDRVPISVSIALTVTIIASFFSVTADLGAAHFIHPAVRYGNESTYLSNSTQRCSTYSLCFGWSTSSYYSDNIMNAMILVINGTHNIPNRVAGRIYQPKTEPYTPICDDFGLTLGNVLTQENSSTYQLSQGSCGDINIGLNIPFALNETNIKVSNSSQDRWSINIFPTFNPDGSYYYNNAIHTFSLTHEKEECLLGYPPSRTEDIMADGLRDIPKTYTRNCLWKNRDLASISHTFFSFQDCLVSKEMMVVECKTDMEESMKGVFLGSEDELFQTMIKSFNQSLTQIHANPESPPKPIQLMEIRRNKTMVETLLCWRVEITNGYICIYNVFDVIEQHLENVSQLHNSSEYPKYIRSPNIQIDMEIDHIFPENSNNLVPVPALKSRNFDATDYMAKLGWNLILINGKTFLAFDTTDPENGFEIPNWLVILLAILMAISLCIWGLTNALLSDRFTSSLYKLVTMEVASKTNSTFPVLVKAQVEPFEVEKVPVLLKSVEEKLQTTIKKNIA